MQRKGRLIVLAGLFYLPALLMLGLFPEQSFLSLPLFLASYALVGHGSVRKALHGILNRNFLDENFLMVLASGGAFFVGEWPEATAVMLFYQVGSLFEDYAVDRSRRSIAALMDIRPDMAHLLRGEEEVDIAPEEAAVGDRIRIKAGEKIPLDGIIRRGSTSVDTRALTGESLPADLSVGHNVISGCVNLTGTIDVEVTKCFEESTASRILALVEDAACRKARTETFITRFARWYTPVVVACAVLLATIPPLLWGGWTEWLYRALSFLVCSCPCALVLSIPLSFFGGLGGASRCGILIKGSNYLEALAQAKMIALDKTGTLTQGTFRVVEICPQEGTEEQLLELAVLAERDSSHPIARSLREAWEERSAGAPAQNARVTSVEEYPGYGIRAIVEERPLHVGNIAFMERLGIPSPPAHEAGTTVYVADEYRCLGWIRVEDELKPHAAQSLSRLRSLGVEGLAMLTGDRTSSAEHVARALNISEIYAQLLPEDKLSVVESLLKKLMGKGTLLYVGDGMNDAPVLARADVGIAMGSMGSDAAIEAADVVIMNDSLDRIADAIRIARRTLRVVRQNILFILGVKFGTLILVAAGLAGMWAAVFADVGVAVLAILHAMTTMDTARP